MAEFVKLKNGGYGGDGKKLRIYQALSSDLRATGERLEVGGNEVYVKKYGFMKKTECLYDSSFGGPVEELDFGAMDDQTIWAYIRGECLVNARLAAEFKGFGAVQVPRDPEAFKAKFCEKIQCPACPRRGRDDCFRLANG